MNDTRRSFLKRGAAAVVGAVTLAGCTSEMDDKQITPSKDGKGTPEGLSGSTFYKDLRLNGEKLTLTVDDRLNVHETGGDQIKADSLVLMHGEDYVAGRTPVYDIAEYTFNVTKPGKYTFVATGSTTDGNDFPYTYELETKLNFSIRDGRVTVESVYYTQQEEGHL